MGTSLTKDGTSYPRGGALAHAGGVHMVAQRCWGRPTPENRPQSNSSEIEFRSNPASKRYLRCNILVYSPEMDSSDSSDSKRLK